MPPENGHSPLTKTTCVVFDCDGVLVDAVSSWRTLHDHFGTDNSENLQRFIRGEITDVEFMRLDIAKWKSIENELNNMRIGIVVRQLPESRIKENLILNMDRLATYD